MRASACVFIELPLAERVALLLEDYAFFLRNPAYFCQRLDALVAQRGKVTVEAWKEAVSQGDFASVVRSLLTEHYDPVYLQSIERNFVRYAEAQRLDIADRGAVAMGQAVAKLV